VSFTNYVEAHSFLLKYNRQKTLKNLLTNKYSYDIIKNVLSIERIAEMINVNLVMLVWLNGRAADL
jgi:hypothetical protein